MSVNNQEHQVAHCRSCGAPIVFLRSGQPAKEGKRRSLMPIDAAGVERTDFQFDPQRHTSHFATCPDAAKHRKPR